MNTKRQTIWLVSMLSLMVVLSAYYLFTDKVDEIDTASEFNGDEDLITIDSVEIGEHPGDAEAQGELADESVDQTEPSGKTDTAVPGNDQEDNKVLQKVQAGSLSGQDYFASLEIKRNEALSKETEQLFDIAMDPDKSSEEVGKAEERLRQIEEMQAKVSDLEGQLMRNFENVVITEDGGKWKVVVQTDNLERSEAVTIIDMMMKNLEIKPGKVAVQYIQ